MSTAKAYLLVALIFGAGMALPQRLAGYFKAMALAWESRLRNDSPCHSSLYDRQRRQVNKVRAWVLLVAVAIATPTAWLSSSP
jgi:hypothetical protein